MFKPRTTVNPDRQIGPDYIQIPPCSLTLSTAFRYPRPQLLWRCEPVTTDMGTANNLIIISTVRSMSALSASIPHRTFFLPHMRYLCLMYQRMTNNSNKVPMLPFSARFLPPSSNSVLCGNIRNISRRHFTHQVLILLICIAAFSKTFSHMHTVSRIPSSGCSHPIGKSQEHTDLTGLVEN